tara:strand:- start:2466 stop:3482 length:1017 start_codon:yes stop_codon:yes gene_type:complete
MKPSELKKFLLKALPAKLPILIKGAPGIGKTDIIKQACKELKYDLIIEHPVVSDPTDYKGLPFADKDKREAHFLPFGNLTALINAKKPTVFFLDDLGQASPMVQAACMQLILARRINGHAVGDNVVFIAATNRKADRAGVTGILEPVKSRFAAIIELEADLDDWIAWGLNNNIPADMIGFLRFRPKLIHDFTPTGDLTNSPCPRTITNLCRVLATGAIDATESVHTKTGIVAGSVGDGFAKEFLSFRNMKDLPDIDEVIRNPKKAPLPKEPSTVFAVVGALAVKATKLNFANIMTYGDRLPKEYMVSLMKDCVGKDATLLENMAYIKWASKKENADLF